MDDTVLRAVNALAFNEHWALVGRALSSGWMIPIVCGPLAVILIRQRRWVAILSIALAMGAGDMVTSRVLKPFFDRPRPCRTLTGLAEPASCGPGKSFPSGHATVAFALFGAGASTTRLAWVFLLPIASLVALSRVLLGVHYPTDIFAGAIVGGLVGFTLAHLRHRLENRRPLTVKMTDND